MIRNIIVILFGIVYDILMLVLLVIAGIFTVFSSKLRHYFKDRFQFKLSNLRGSDVLFFCSSIGEFDQIIPLIEIMKNNGYKSGILFLSRNGIKYAKQLNYSAITLSPFDSFIFYLYCMQIIKPKMCIINRNEVWPGFVWAVSLFCPIFLTNFIDRKYNFIAKKCIHFLFSPIKIIFTCNSLNYFKYSKYKFIGDTKVDRSLQRLQSEEQAINKLKNEHQIPKKKILVLGNAYKKDLELLVNTLKEFPELLENWQFIVIPSRPNQLQNLEDFVGNEFKSTQSIKILPSFGVLIHFYAISDISWIGGGFDAGVHNVIEAYCAGKLVISGPNLNQQPLAVELHTKNISKLISSTIELNEILRNYTPNKNMKLDNQTIFSNVIFTNIVEYESNHSR